MSNTTTNKELRLVVAGQSVNLDCSQKAQSPIPCQTGLCQGGWDAVLFARRRQVRATAMRHFCCHAYALAQGGVRMYGFTDVDRVGAHFYGQSNLAEHVARVGADDAAAQDLAVAVIDAGQVEPLNRLSVKVSAPPMVL